MGVHHASADMPVVIGADDMGVDAFVEALFTCECHIEAVACPECGAPAGEPCRDDRGTRLARVTHGEKFHKSRQEVAET